MAEPRGPLAAGEYWFEDLAAGDQYETGHLTQLDLRFRGGDLRRRPDRGQGTRREGPLVGGQGILTLAFRVMRRMERSCRKAKRHCALAAEHLKGGAQK
jgi:hypothetical protein